LNIVVLVIVLILFKYKKPKSTPDITLFQINNIVSEIISDDYLKFDHIFINDEIPKSIFESTFSDSVMEKMNINNLDSFMQVHQFLKREENDQFIESQKSRFDIPYFKLLTKNIILPYFTDAIFKQMTHYSEYISLGSIFTIYRSGIRDTDKHINEIFDVFNLMMRFSNEYVKINCHLLFTDLKKRSSPGELVGLAKNINSGMTFGNTIIIWREEEILKVFIHEMVHLLKLDIIHHGNPLMKILDSMKISFSDNSIYNLGEAYTETVAKIIHSIYKGRGISGFKGELDKQIDWSMIQCSRILFLNNIRNIGTDINVIEQHSYLIEYYVLHAFFMHNIKTTGDISIYINFFRQNYNQLSRDEVSEYLSSLDTSSFIKEVNNILNEIPLDFANKPRNLSMTPITS